MRMSEEQFDRERRYQVAMYFVRRMLDEGLISQEEYCQIDTKNLGKFKPVTGNLLSGNFLLCASFRATMKLGKEAQSVKIFPAGTTVDLFRKGTYATHFEKTLH
ncbi:MAG: hypothetical protein IJ242_05120 [Clostridia bacterium]|nr:hypothetical protein [Clostridia bacterium]